MEDRPMLVWLLKCKRCDHQFEQEWIDNDDPAERDLPRSYGRLLCPQCQHEDVDKIKFLGRRPLRLTRGR